MLSGGIHPIEDVRLTYPTAADVPPPRAQGSSRPGSSMSKADKQRCGCLRGDLLALAAGQGRQMGRMVNVCPEALLDDGLLDFTVMFGSLGKQVGARTCEYMPRGRCRKYISICVAVSSVYLVA